MEPEVYRRMMELEEKHWWFTARREIIAAKIAQLSLPEDANLLEAGCGTGGNLGMLSRFGRVHAFEPCREAREHARSKHPLCDIEPGELPTAIPYPEGVFDLTAAFDVLEHIEDDLAALKALIARLKPGGYAILTVPACPTLWSRHDELHHHRRRYRKKELVSKCAQAGLKPQFTTHFNTFLFPLLAAARIVKNALNVQSRDDAMPPQPLNDLLCSVFSAEKKLLQNHAFPFGLSLLMVARKPTRAGVTHLVTFEQGTSTAST